MSGLTINFAKSEVMVLGYSGEESRRIANMLNYRLGSFPTSYLGLPISDSRLQAKDLRPTVSKLQPMAPVTTTVTMTVPSPALPNSPCPSSIAPGHGLQRACAPTLPWPGFSF